MLQYYALFSAIVFIVPSITIVLATGLDRTQTISQHVAKTKITSIAFAITCLLTVALLVPYFYVWIPQNLQLNPIFYFLIGLILLQLVIVGIFPHSTGRSATIHQFAAWGLVYTILPTTVFLFANLLSSLNTISNTVFICFMIFSAVTILLRKRDRLRFKRHVLLIETSYIIGFFICIISLSLK
jgi:hypothetical protein